MYLRDFNFDRIWQICQLNLSFGKTQFCMFAGGWRFSYCVWRPVSVGLYVEWYRYECRRGCGFRSRYYTEDDWYCVLLPWRRKTTRPQNRPARVGCTRLDYVQLKICLETLLRYLLANNLQFYYRISSKYGTGCQDQFWRGALFRSIMIPNFISIFNSTYLRK